MSKLMSKVVSYLKPELKALAAKWTLVDTAVFTLGTCSVYAWFDLHSFHNKMDEEEKACRSAMQMELLKPAAMKLDMGMLKDAEAAMKMAEDTK